MRALYTAATGMAAQELNVQVISNNIANLRTTGYKKQEAEFEDLLYQNVRLAAPSGVGGVGPGGVQGLEGIRPDLTMLGKIIGGGLPVGAYGGRAALMDLVAPLGPVYQAGTLSGNPLAMAAGIATLEALNQPDVYDRLEKSGAALEAGLCEIGKRLKIPLVVQRVGSMFTVFFSAHPIFGASDLPRADAARFAKVFHALLEAGVYFPPSPYEAAFLSLAHETRDLTFTLDAFEKALSAP